MKTLYISDLDGTLLGADSRVSAESRRLLNEAIASGTLFSIATARTPGTVVELMSGVDMKLPGIVLTGAAMWNFHSGKYSEVKYMAPEAVEYVRAAYERREAPAFIYTLRGDKLEVYHFGKLNAEERAFMEARRYNPYKVFHVDDSGRSEIPSLMDDVVLFFGIQPTETARKVLADIKDYPLITPMFYHDALGPDLAEMEAFSDRTSKAAAVEHLADMVGADRIVVFGDNMNDISMMKVADKAVAVANAVDEVKAIADEVIESNTADAVAKYIRYGDI